MSARNFVLTADLLLRAYRLGMFPMAESRVSRALHWLDPEYRGVLPLGQFHFPRSLMKTLRRGQFTVTANASFADTIAACAAARANRPETWINQEIERLFIELHNLGFAHSIETWLDGKLVGGLYGACLGGAFFGESMFSVATDASKAALVHLVARLRLGGFKLLDTQFITAHLTRFGAVEVPRDDYHIMLAEAVEIPARFPETPDPAVLQAEINALYAYSREDSPL
ncbi:MAG: leucyl/phenylalanyl-tRNA--protein transferase [Acidocella sp. 20-57-95]|nr:MAG: leucyl/phenylalanyl-tRNA--protein transferase [Acidocella sp. 20-57-95]OYV62566.1 MAG: leucyl/phenylalanyl-tRNA--protein transferase [Acidocella sp. 21-58-7]HQT64307.1 leucyl/phenylalanyl-tRNA--protein transferase [Acidocella sp.]HQU04472.1 leucyl/phenylalanyl-tRNA--protein transferase [Acidocella sp.]